MAQGPLPWLRPAVFTGALVPLAAILLRAARGELGANPIAEALNRLGLVALVFLLLTLACTPMKPLFGWTWPARLRRMLGLFAFFYATSHVATYAGLDQVLDVGAIAADIAKRSFILAGFLAWLLMIPLALTSTDAMVKRLGFRRWKLLHRLAYLCAALGVVHFVLRVKADLTEPLLYGAVLAALLVLRLVGAARGRPQRTLVE
ncbi:MAG: sulfite oxidase heme-binding subunit YedZ [Myxococcota bacterium]